MRIKNALKSYFFSFILLLSIVLGGFVGYYFPHQATILKPLGDIFLNLIFTAIVPLVFFSVSSAIARAGSLNILSKILFYMVLVFIITGSIASLYAILVVKLFPPTTDINLHLNTVYQIQHTNFAKQVVGIFTAPDFTQLFSHENMLPLIIFSILVGLAAATIRSSKIIKLLNLGENVFLQLFTIIMYYAPVGFFAYFAFLISDLGPKLLSSYTRVFILYYVAATLYFLVAYTLYAYIAGKSKGVKTFWGNIFLPMATAFATCSSAASIPANLIACKAIRLPKEIYETVIPLGTIIHKEGTTIGAIFKIAFLFGVFQLHFGGAEVLFTAIFVSLLVGTVMGAIPSGGMLGELLILSFYGFPPSVLMVIAAISIIIDPLATMVNVTGNVVATMLISKFTAKQFTT